MADVGGGSLGIALRPVKRVVYGRENRRGRVRYEGEIPEQVILERWHEAGFGGHRLRPNIWRVLGQIPALRRGSTLEELTNVLRGKKLEGGEISKLLPRPVLVFDLLAALSPPRLNALIKRHSEGPDVRPDEPGVPDLFLFKRRADGVPYGVRFVEVKRPGERIHPHQISEIAFMRSIGLRAGVVRLIERPTPRY